MKSDLRARIFAKPEIIERKSDCTFRNDAVARATAGNLSVDQVKKMLQEKDFLHSDHNKCGKGLRHKYEINEKNGEKLVLDQFTGLAWQQSGSSNSMPYSDPKQYIDELNSRRFAGCNGWCLPTLEEAMSLREPKRRGDWYLDSVFNRKQRWIWTADKAGASLAWLVLLQEGYCDRYDVHGLSTYVRAVRRGQSTI